MRKRKKEVRHGRRNIPWSVESVVSLIGKLITALSILSAPSAYKIKDFELWFILYARNKSIFQVICSYKSNIQILKFYTVCFIHIFIAKDLEKKWKKDDKKRF